jgi:hypothetical protein
MFEEAKSPVRPGTTKKDFIAMNKQLAKDGSRSKLKTILNVSQ